MRKALIFDLEHRRKTMGISFFDNIPCADGIHHTNFTCSIEPDERNSNEVTIHFVPFYNFSLVSNDRRREITDSVMSFCQSEYPGAQVYFAIDREPELVRCKLPITGGGI